MTATEVQAASRRMWKGGPLRRWAESKLGSNWIPYEGGFAASYVCDQCGRQAQGVYRGVSGWYCANCKEKAKASKRLQREAVCLPVKGKPRRASRG